MLTVMGTTASRTLRGKGKSSISTMRRRNEDAAERSRLLETLSDLHNLLEEYAPAWYTERHHRQVKLALHPGKES